MSRLFLILLIALLPVTAASADDYLSSLEAAAQTQRLGDAPEWRALLHYRGHASEVVTPDFFLAADGRHDPAAELGATLAAFFAPAMDADASAQCRFVARYHWLKEQLHFDVARLPERQCPAFTRWYAGIDAGDLVLVFPAAYLNNPASMYGHTFLRFDRTGRGPEAELESPAVNFSADIAEGDGLAAAYKGLFGRYRGRFQIEPYYRMVREYADIQDRDIWEYRLAYTPAERQRILEHLWELKDARFRYYFFDRNCSYYLLALLDVARPEHPLALRFVYQVIPGDALQGALSQPDLLEQERYRPSLATRLRTRLAAMDDTDRARVLAMLSGHLTPGTMELQALPPGRQAAIYDTVTDRLLYTGARGEQEKDDYAPLMQAVIQARASLPEDADALPTPGTDPALGHGSMRLGLGAGSEAGSCYTELSLRGAYHDLLDPTPGFAAGAAIDMGEITLRRYAADARVHLESLELFEVTALTPRDLFYQPLSWDVGAGWGRRWLGAGRRPLLGDLHTGLGVSYDLGDGGLIYALMDASLLTGGGIADGYALGMGPRAGLLWRAAPRLNLELNAAAQDFPDHLHGISLGYTAAANLALGRDASLRLSWSRQGLPGDMEDETGLHLYWYF